ncbi:hypothetical protein K7432_016849 [Basidiobolus ranarum]|uniref:Uncharacterized protein n=1 Tax=Basidiobolus ranarum TaxID=34480 RepID=A0ABR2WE59_9FUNG
MICRMLWKNEDDREEIFFHPHIFKILGSFNGGIEISTPAMCVLECSCDDLFWKIMNDTYMLATGSKMRIIRLRDVKFACQLVFPPVAFEYANSNAEFILEEYRAA